MGTSTNLKNRYAGYKVEVIVKQHYVDQMKELVREKLPGEFRKLLTVWCLALNRYSGTS